MKTVQRHGMMAALHQPLPHWPTDTLRHHGKWANWRVELGSLGTSGVRFNLRGRADGWCLCVCVRE